MQQSNAPAKIPTAFAASGTRRVPAATSGAIATPEQPSWDVGWPVITETDPLLGGIPPGRQDFNGLGFALSGPAQWAQSGGQYQYDSAFTTAIGGYPKGARLLSSDGVTMWVNTVENNTTNPDAGGANWQKEAGGIGVADAGGWFANSPKTVESALQELANPQAQFAYSYNALRQVPIAKWAAILNRTSTDDHSAYVQAAVNMFGNASSTAQGQVYLPAGKWNLNSAGLVFPYEVGINGAGGRATHLCVNGDFDAISFSPTIPSFSFQGGRFSDLWITGPGYGMQGATRITMAQAYTASSAGTNIANIAAVYPGVVPFTVSSCFNLNHPFGNEPHLDNLWIEDFPNYGIRTNQPGNSSVLCMQFVHWNQVYMRYCNIGLLMGYGFTGESEFTTIVSQFMLTSCADFTINGNLVGPQGLKFNSLIGGWSPYGVRLLAGSTGNLVFDQLHMESCTTAGIYSNASSLGKVILRSPWFAKCPIAFKGDAGGTFLIDSGTWTGNGSATDSFIKLTAASNFNIKLTGQHTIIANGTGPTDHISTTDIGTIRGNVLRKSATTGTINSAVDVNTVAQARGFMSELSTVLPANFSGRATIGNAATTVVITFTRSEPDINYNLACAIDWAAVTPPAWAHNMQVGNKTTSGFTVTFGAAAPAGGAVLTWVLTR